MSQHRTSTSLEQMFSNKLHVATYAAALKAAEKAIEVFGKHNGDKHGIGHLVSGLEILLQEVRQVSQGIITRQMIDDMLKEVCMKKEEKR